MIWLRWEGKIEDQVNECSDGCHACPLSEHSSVVRSQTALTGQNTSFDDQTHEPSHDGLGGASHGATSAEQLLNCIRPNVDGSINGQ